MNIKKITLWVLCIITVSLAIFLYIKEYRLDHYSCRGKVEIHDHNTTYFANVEYIFNGGRGEVVSQGTYINHGYTPQEVAQHVQFDYARHGKEIVMLSSVTALDDKKSQLLEDLIPDFYLYKNRGFRHQILKINDNGYLFLTYSVPVFICTSRTF